MKKLYFNFSIAFLFLMCFSNTQAQDITSDLSVYYNFTNAQIDAGINDQAPSGNNDKLVKDDNVGFSVENNALVFKNITDIATGHHSGMTGVLLQTEAGADISDFKATTQLTYATWIKLPAGFDHIYAPVMLGAWNGPGKLGWNVICWGNVQNLKDHGQFMFQVGDGSPSSVMFAHPDGSTGGKDEWMHIAFTYNGGAGDAEMAIKSYFNGQLVNAEGASLLGAEVPDQIAYNDEQVAAMNLRTSNEITFDEVRVYKRALSAADISALYQVKPDQATSIFSSEISESDVYVVSQDNELEINNASTGMNYTIVDIAGKVIEAGVLQASSTNINTSSWTNGIYIVKVDNQAFKVIK